MDAASEKKEVVLVTDDVLTIKDKFEEERVEDLRIFIVAIKTR